MTKIPGTIRDCKCLDKEAKEWLIKGLDDAIGYNAYRMYTEKEKGTPETLATAKWRSERKSALEGLMYDVKNTPECKQV